MYRDMRELDNKFEYLMDKTEAYLHPITEFFQRYLNLNHTNHFFYLIKYQLKKCFDNC